MIMDAVKEQLLVLKQRILTWPDTVDEYAPQQDIHDVFKNLETQLAHLLTDVEKTSGLPRQELDAILTDFQEKMQERFTHTKQQLEEMQRETQTASQYLNATKVYGRG